MCSAIGLRSKRITVNAHVPVGSSERRCLYVYLYGLEVHVYNRTSVYDALRDLFQIKQEKSPDSSQICSLRFGSRKNAEGLISHSGGSNKHHALVEDDDDDENNAAEESAQGFLDMFWTHARRLLHSVKFNLELVSAFLRRSILRMLWNF
ncbi:unnamed protein product [Echinostoma caproni]|uniref:Tify domain-containing protein n=1 Tax=Echinostoma caproni TaxID=27848 RepID=A0A183BB27_9TREM|nr:unnamed protein product [Echinostoma caproni]